MRVVISQGATVYPTVTEPNAPGSFMAVQIGVITTDKQRCECFYTHSTPMPAFTYSPLVE